MTGGLGTGKTTVARIFSSLGAKVIDADKINHQLMKRNGSSFKSIVKSFGQKILTDGDIDRKKLGAVVFNNSKRLKKLCRIVHPAIISKIKNRISHYQKNKSNQIIIIDAPLLIEAGLDRLVDILIVVKASRRKQIQRVIRRMNIKRSEVLKRLKAQMPLKDKIRLADITIDNNGSLTKTKKEVRRIWQKLLKKK